MPKKQEKKQIKFCGKTKKEIRKAYFNGKLKKLLAEIQSEEEWEEKDILELGKYLEELRKGEKSFAEKICEMFGGKIIEDDDPKPPTTDKLFSEQGGDDLKEWEEKVKKAKDHIRHIRELANKAVYANKPMSKDTWSGWALNIETLKRWISEDYRWKEQLYHKRICDIIDEFGTSRREAEDRAKITKEYFDYKTSKDEYTSLEEVVLICKKRASTEY